jgi:aminopeptidase N
MTNSESIFQFGPNAYGKPATALNILRETVMGRELFDYAFKEYGRRWAFKRPTPADLFRTMEDASSVDLDWFWRGWFYTNDHVDLSLKDIQWYQISSGDPDVEKALAKAEQDAQPEDISLTRDETYIAESRLEARPELNDHYTTVDPYAVMEIEREEYKDYVAQLDEEELKMLSSGKHFYQLTFENLGGLVMPVIVGFTYEDGTTDVRRVPVEIWRKGSKEVTKVFVTPQEAVSITLDPYLETADTDLTNNAWPRNVRPQRIDLYNDATRGYGRDAANPMQRVRENQDYIESLED